ncbi:hypothetical protein V1477_008342, partial [Vespula maculifrons]
MHMGPVKLDSARFSRKCDISVSTEFPTTLRNRFPVSCRKWMTTTRTTNNDDDDDDDDDGNVNDEQRAND